MSQFQDNVLIESIIEKLPPELADKFNDPLLKCKCWSEEWEELAKDITMSLNIVRDEGIISQSEWNYIHTMIFHSFGKIGSTVTNDFFRFYIGI